MFFILQFQDAVLRRAGSEDSRIPHFLYIDEFPEYINKDMDVMFTLFRKYRCGVTIAIQNLSQLEKSGKSYYRQTVLANTKTKSYLVIQFQKIVHIGKLLLVLIRFPTLIRLTKLERMACLQALQVSKTKRKREQNGIKLKILDLVLFSIKLKIFLEIRYLEKVKLHS